MCAFKECAFEKHYGDGVRDGSVSMVSFLKIRNGLGARKGENRFMDPNTPPNLEKVRSSNGTSVGVPERGNRKHRKRAQRFIDTLC